MRVMKANNELAPIDTAAYAPTRTLDSRVGAQPGVDSYAEEPLTVTDDTSENTPGLPFFGRQVPLPASLRALGHRNFRLFWTGQLVSLIGTWMQNVARGWLVLELTHSAFWLGMVGFANAVPVLLFSLWAGAIADNVSKRKLVMWMQSVQMVASFVLAALTFTHTVEVWHVIAVSIIMGSAFAFDAPARQALTVDMVGKRDLVNAVALNSAIFNGARVLGPAIGAVALAWQGPGLAFFLNGLSYLAVLVGLAMMDVPDFKKKLDEASPWQRVREGLAYVRHDSTIASVMLLVSVVSVFAFPYAILMPIFADSVLHVGQPGYGMLMALSGVGALIGALTLTVKSGSASVKRGRMIMAGATGLPVFLGLFALSSNYLLSLAMLIGVGWTMIAINATTNTLVQTNVPDELRGRVNGVFAFLFVGMAPLGNLQAGLVADHFGAPMAIFIGSLVCAIVALFLFVRKRDLISVA